MNAPVRTDIVTSASRAAALPYAITFSSLIALFHAAAAWRYNDLGTQAVLDRVLLRDFDEAWLTIASADAATVYYIHIAEGRGLSKAGLQ